MPRYRQPPSQSHWARAVRHAGMLAERRVVASASMEGIEQARRAVPEDSLLTTSMLVRLGPSARGIRQVTSEATSLRVGALIGPVCCYGWSIQSLLLDFGR